MPSDRQRGRQRLSSSRGIAVLVAGSVLASLAVNPQAAADDLENRKDRVQREIRRADQHLDQSSGALLAATKALSAAQAELTAAESHLAKTRGELATAVALDRRMQADLEAAVRALRRSRAELSKGRTKVAEQEELLGQIAAQNYQVGDPTLVGLSMVLTSQDPAELSSQLNSMQNVLDKESMTLDRLDASRILLTVQEETVEAAKAAVARQRAAAAENLRSKAALENQAEQAEVRVRDMVSARSSAQDTAARARAADLSQLRDLEKERLRISALLKRRAEEARRRAAAAAEARRQAAAEQARKRGAAAASAAAARARAQARKVTAPADNGLRDPVNGYVTSSYGMRFHPIYQRLSLHDGTDFGASCGTPIRAAASGTVIAMYYNSGYGNRVIMDHGFRRGVGLGTSYNHLSGYSAYVGQRVQRGEIIGYVGTTGASTGCHLHFMVFENGATVNPMNWL